MKRFFLFLILLAATTASHAQRPVPRPKLVVGIVVDQMRWDYLYKYYNRFGQDGFKRLIGEGFNCQNTFINYLPSFTGPGHSCIYTGSVPSIHGIAANDWIENKTGRHVYCTEDDAVLPVGGSSTWGRMSPRNLRVSSITDELRLATNFHSRVYGISLKDRGSILPAGHLANAAYWYDDSTGNFFTSNYYTDKLPEWLNKFNARHLPDSLIKQPWEPLYPANTYTQSLPDNNRYEGLMKGEKEPSFPHNMSVYIGRDYNAIRRTPAGNTFSFKMAKACINGTTLGQQGECDFLALSLSATDYVGHQYAPNAMEIEDLYLRLDQDIASFLRYLDEHIGEGQYTIFLTADHGAAHNSLYLDDIKLPGGNAKFGTLQSGLLTYLKQTYHTDSMIRSLDNYQVYFNEGKIASGKIDRVALRHNICKWLEDQPGMAYAVDVENLSNATIPNSLREMILNGYDRKRSGSIQIIMEPGWYSGYALTGTTHGTWSPYDTHIPLLWYGWGIKKGETNRQVNMTDISATLAALLHIQMPNGCIGKVIEEVIK